MMNILTPLRAIRAKCLDCTAGDKAGVRFCDFGNCYLLPFRAGHGIRGKGSLVKAIRAHCISCMNGQRKEVVLCTSPDCPLYSFRMGRRPRKSCVGPSLTTQPPRPVLEGAASKYSGRFGRQDRLSAGSSEQSA